MPHAGVKLTGEGFLASLGLSKLARECFARNNVFLKKFVYLKRDHFFRQYFVIYNFTAIPSPGGLGPALAIFFSSFRFCSLL